MLCLNRIFDEKFKAQVYLQFNKKRCASHKLNWTVLIKINKNLIKGRNNKIKFM